MSTTPPELALSAEEVEQILKHCDGQALLVGGQSLALWAQRYELPRPDVLAVAVSNDVDFLGSVRVARALHRALAGSRWQLWEPKKDAAKSQTAKLNLPLSEGIKQIDFLDGLIGMSADQVQGRAVQWQLPDGKWLRIMHPLDVLSCWVFTTSTGWTHSLPCPWPTFRTSSGPNAGRTYRRGPPGGAPPMSGGASDGLPTSRSFE